ncbi:MAG: ACT domain-containing protein [Firmicutes bacterium]|nr:ACT domain-containing protein [Bacillota bacterium]HXL04154.1 ACT domain-containing protein [Bacillota bacterium]
MKAKQLSIFLENKVGRLAEVTDVLGDKDINIRALSLADTSDFGVLRLIVDDPDRAEKALREDGYTVSITEVIAVKVPDKPGGLSRVLKSFADLEVNVEYMYAFAGKNGDNAVVVFRVDDPERAIPILQQHGVALLTEDEIYQ